MLHLLTILSVFFSVVSALAIPLVARDVAVPPVTEPSDKTVWKVGSKQTVKWDTSNLPPKENITNIHGTVLLGFLTDDSENLMSDTPLAKGFSLLDGQVEITVPNVEPRDDYIVALIGNSGNISPKFTIGKAGNIAAASGTSSSSSESISWGIPITGTTITGGSATTTSTIADPSLSVPSGTTTTDATTSASATAPPSTSATPSGESSGASAPSATPSGAALSARGGSGMLITFSTVLGALILL
jgi:hypothetical protein